MLNSSDMLRGHTDTIILAQLMASDSYGYLINKRVRQATGGLFELKEATLYTTFRRLEQGGYITSYWGDEQTGTRRRYYAITPEGRALYGENLEDWRRVRGWIDHLTGMGGKVDE